LQIIDSRSRQGAGESRVGQVLNLYNILNLSLMVQTLKLTSLSLASLKAGPMEQRALKNVSNCLNTNIYSYLETSGGEISNLYLNVVHFFNTSGN
jgi:hypothetical protein